MNKNVIMAMTIAAVVLAIGVAVAGTNSAEAVEVAGGEKSATLFSEERLASLGSPYHAEPKGAKLLNEYGGLVLFAGETESDAAFNAEAKQNDNWDSRNSLFLRRRMKSGKDEWRLLLTSGGDWKDADGMDKWCKACADDIRYCFDVLRASLSKDGRYIWLVCDRHISMYYVVCRFDLRENSLRVLTDGDSADEEPDGTIWVLNKKIYLYDKNGEPDGAAWIEEWITPDGKVVRKGEPKRQEDVLVYDEAVKLRRNERAKEQKGKTK